MWYRYTAPNRGKHYGWTTREAVAEATLEELSLSFPSPDLDELRREIAPNARWDSFAKRWDMSDEEAIRFVSAAYAKYGPAGMNLCIAVFSYPHNSRGKRPEPSDVAWAKDDVLGAVVHVATLGHRTLVVDGIGESEISERLPGGGSRLICRASQGIARWLAQSLLMATAS